MTEQQLINLGFQRTEVTEQESGDVAFYYYTLDFVPHLSLITDADCEIVDESWDVTLFEVPELKFTSYDRLKEFINVVDKNLEK